MERIPIIGIDVGLTQNTAQSADWNFTLPRHDSGVDNVAEPPHKLNVTALLACLDEACRF
jgi:hypothetical protein